MYLKTHLRKTLGKKIKDLEEARASNQESLDLLGSQQIWGGLPTRLRFFLLGTMKGKRILLPNIKEN